MKKKQLVTLFFLAMFTATANAALIQVTFENTKDTFQKTVQFDENSSLIETKEVEFNKGSKTVSIKLRIGRFDHIGTIAVKGLVESVEMLESKHLEGTPLAGLHDRSTYSQNFATYIRQGESVNVADYQKNDFDDKGNIKNSEKFKVTLQNLN